ncbi:uncharacterized protein EKO05_0008672 [Ascochyta rabiei]|uniref:Uncharacterized protein n=1 Tax=Didymella rabiei TaxID=5454 RepID=A0A163FVS1_DIDRA|nr:uncharacterized protein EKO05_0008672 [Ascochyta rabiei]KZM24560.1 hypothetical protein ST47_g4254 [Ascochyta rabiei]UPX18370.1 hypothetical protein EKO05_0008672 [Ascochyta rabiei]
MSFFLPFVLALAVFWLLIGIMLAKFLAQKYKGRPWSARTVDTQYIYGSALANDRSAGGAYGNGYGYGRVGERAGFGAGYGREGAGLGRFGEGRVKGM